MFWEKNFVQEKSADWSETESDCAGDYRMLSNSDIWWQSDTILIAKNLRC